MTAADGTVTVTAEPMTWTIKVERKTGRRPWQYRWSINRQGPPCWYGPFMNPYGCPTPRGYKTREDALEAAINNIYTALCARKVTETINFTTTITGPGTTP